MLGVPLLSPLELMEDTVTLDSAFLTAHESLCNSCHKRVGPGLHIAR